MTYAQYLDGWTVGAQEVQQIVRGPESVLKASVSLARGYISEKNPWDTGYWDAGYADALLSSLGCD